jgi:hypothetical protein
MRFAFIILWFDDDAPAALTAAQFFSLPAERYAHVSGMQFLSSELAS